MKWILAILCLCSGVAPLAARWIPDNFAKVSYGAAVTLFFLLATILTKRNSSLQQFWELPFAFFVFALIQVLNNTLPGYIGTYILHQAPTAGNPFASTVSGSVVIQLLETLIAIIPIVVLTKAFGMNLGSIYLQRGRLGRWFIFAIISFFILYFFTITIPLRQGSFAQRLIPTNSTLTLNHLLTLTPALLSLVISNGFQEELLFRGLFLKRYNTLFGAGISNLLQAIIFSIAHAGVTYTPMILLFIVAIILPIGLFMGYLMRKTNSILTPALFHAGVDFPLYLAFLSYVT
jgi:membrane protease YdiL (CAAX protease family)